MPFVFDEAPNASPSGWVFEDESPATAAPVAAKKGRSWAQVAGDTGIDLAKGVVGLGESAVGLADLVTGNLAGQGLAAVGYDPERTKQALGDLYSDPRQQANQNVSEAKGFVGTAQALIDNPSAIVGGVAESAPMMLGSVGAVRALAAKMLAARGLAVGSAEAGAYLSSPAVASQLALAGSATEGAMAAGSIQEQGRQAGRDYIDTAPSALAGGALTAAIGFGTSKIPGLRDAEVGMATAGMGGAQRQGLLAAGKTIAKGTFKEGVLEEMPQSAQEQVFTNLALGKPWAEGVSEAAAQGMMVGAAQGGGMNVYSARRNAMNAPSVVPAEPVPPEEIPLNQPIAPVDIAQAAINNIAQNTPAASDAGATPGVASSTLQPETTESEKALLAPVVLTSLDRVNEIDTELAPVRQRLAELTPENGYGPMFDQERLDLTAQAATLDQERVDLSKDWPKSVPGVASSFTTEAGARVEAQYALMDAADLITSHDEGLRKNPLYPPELQPRERDRAASEVQVAAINQKLDPARLGWSADAATGAPIVGADGLVESGNARTIALKRVYQQNGQHLVEYKQFLRDNATQFGITPESIDAMAKPVLVRVRTTPVNRAEFARQANASTVAAMAPSEQAKSDADRIDSMADLSPNENGDFSNSASRPFIMRFMARLPQTELAGMQDADGNLSTTGYARVRNAVLAKAYGDSPVLARMTESADDNLRNISKAFMLAAPKVAVMRSAIKAGTRFDADITPDLMSASEELARIKTDGGSVADALAQTDMMGDQRTPESRQLLQFMNDNMRRPRRMADFISAYMDALEAAGDPKQDSMFGDVQAPTKQDLLTAAERATTNETPNPGTATQGTAQQAGGPVGQEPSNAPGSGSSPQGNGANAGTPAQGSAAEAGAGQTTQPVSTDWVEFAPETGAMGIPRVKMPQVKADKRPALYAFLESKGISNTRTFAKPESLKPTQAEYSPSKAENAKALDGSKAMVLASSDGYILDGHHRWVSRAAMGELVDVIKFNAPMGQLLAAVRQFPGATTSNESGAVPATSAAVDLEKKQPVALTDKAQSATNNAAIESPAVAAPAAAPLASGDAVSWQLANGKTAKGVVVRADAGAKGSATVRATGAEAGAGVAAGGVFNVPLEKLAAQAGPDAPTVKPAAESKPVKTARKYNLVAVNEKTGAKTPLSRTPMTHAEAVTNKSKFDDKPGRRIELEEVDGRVSAPDAFVKAPNGTLDFGEITPEMSKAMRRQAGKIRLQQGNASFGLSHIEARHGKQIKGMGYADAASFVADALKNMDSIWLPDKTSQLVVVQSENLGRAVFIQLKPGKDDQGDFYTINTAFPTGEGYAENKEGWKTLWSRVPVPADSPGKLSSFADSVDNSGQQSTVEPNQSVETSLPQPAAENKPDSDSGTRLSVADRNAATAAPAQGMAMDAVQAVATRIKAKMPNMPEVVVLATPAEAPAELLSEIEKQGAMGDVEGAMHEGKLYLFASGLADPLRAEHVLAEHEAAHFGLRGVLGGELATVMQSIFNNNATVRQAAAKLQGRGKLSDAQATEEVIVDIPSAELVKLNGWRKVVVKARDWLAGHGFDAMAAKLSGWLDGKLDDQQRADLFVADLVRSARAYVKGKVVAAPLAQDRQKQAQWLRVEAQSRGYKDIDTLAEKNAALFENLAKLWRKTHPGEGDVVLGRDAAQLKKQFDETASAYGGKNAFEAAKSAGRTKLTYAQWVHVRTPNFMQWWGYDWTKGLQNGQKTQDVGGREDGSAGGRDQGGADAGIVRGRANAVGVSEIQPVIARGLPFVDAETGEPLVFFHGTRDTFSEFDVNHPNKKDAGWLGRGHYVSNDRWVAEEYSKRKAGSGQPQVMELFVRPSNPFVMLPKNKLTVSRYSPEQLTRFNAKLQAAGYQSSMVAFDEGLLEVALFEANSLKSATGNTGAFGPSNDIYLSRAPQPGAPTGPVAPNNPSPLQQLKAKALGLVKAETIGNLIYDYQDKYIDLKNLRDHIKAIGGTITDLNDAYLGEELYHKRLSKRTEDFLSDEIKPLLAEMRNYGVTMEVFEEFLHARHAPEANAAMAARNPTQAEIDAGQAAADAELKSLQKQLQGAVARGAAIVAIEKSLVLAKAEAFKWSGATAFKGTEEERLSLSGMSDAKALSVLAGAAPDKRAKLDALAAKVDAINAKTLDTLAQYGLMEQAALDAWRNAYKFYIPLHRDEAHPDSVSHPIGMGFSVKGDASKRRTGSNAKVTHILGHLAMQREAALTRGEKNTVVKKLYVMAAQNPDKDVWEVDKVPMLTQVDKKTGFVTSYPDPMFKNKPNVVMVRIAGKDAAIVFNERNPEAVRLAGAMKNIDVGDLGYSLQQAARVTRWFAAVNTQYNPVFGLVNFARDVQAGLLNLSTTELAGQQAEVAAGVPAAMRAVYRQQRGKGAASQENARWIKLWGELQEVGGTTGYRDLYPDAKDRATALVDELQKLDRGQVSEAAHAVVKWLGDYNDAMENSVRLSAYKMALDKGMSRERAASLAKNLTVNFNRKGAKTQSIGALYAFFNAAIQGNTRVFQTLKGPLGRRVMYGGIALGMVSSLLGMAVMGGGDGEDDEWAAVPEFVKARSVIIPVGHQDYIAIPLPLGFHIFPNIGRIAAEWAMGGKDVTLAKQTVKLLSAIVDATNPIGGGSDLGQVVMPTVMDPMLALWRNKDWTGRPIYREDMSTLDPTPGFTRSKDSASMFSKLFAEAINKVTGGSNYRPGALSPTPDQIDYVIGQVTGGLGRELLKVEQVVTSPFTGDELPAHKIPVLGRIYGNTRGAGAQSEQFYGNVKELNEVKNEIIGRTKNSQDPQGYRESEPLSKLIGVGAGLEKLVSQLRKMRRSVIEGEKPGYKDKVKEIDARIEDAMRKLNRDVSKVQNAAAG